MLGSLSLKLLPCEPSTASIRVTCPLSGLLHVFGALPYDTTYQLHLPAVARALSSSSHSSSSALTTPFAPIAIRLSPLPFSSSFSFVVCFQRELDFVFILIFQFQFNFKRANSYLRT
jgi:hypothetical protein